jgi:methylphosphotriester-DNA--protein-cysteine methyltransferase
MNVDDSRERLNICMECPIGKQIRELGKQLDNKPRKKAQKLLSKGGSLTLSDIKSLLELGVTKKEIAKAAGVSPSEFYEYLKSHGLLKEVKKVSNIEEAKKLLKETDLSVTEIAKRTGTKEATVYYHSRKIRTGETKTEQANTENTWKTKYEQLKTSYDNLKEEYKQLHQDYLDLKEQLREFPNSSKLYEKIQALENVVKVYMGA